MSSARYAAVTPPTTSEDQTFLEWDILELKGNVLMGLPSVDVFGVLMTGLKLKNKQPFPHVDLIYTESLHVSADLWTVHSERHRAALKSECLNHFWRRSETRSSHLLQDWSGLILIHT